MKSYKMKKFNSNEYYKIKKDKYNKHDINVNLWDLEGSNFFLDKDINENKSKRDYNHTSIISKNKSISSKNITKDFKEMKTKNKPEHSSFIKYNNVFDKRIVKNEKAKKDFDLKKNILKHNSFFCNKYEKNSLNIDIKNEYKKRTRKRFNYSVDYSRNEYTNMALLYSNNNDISFKNKRINTSLLIDTLNNKADNKRIRGINSNSSLKKTKNIISIKFNNYNKKEKSSITENNNNENNNFNIRNIKNINQSLYNNALKKKKEIKLNSDNLSRIQNKKKSTISKITKENAEKYTNYLYKKKIFTHDYDLQNKLKREKDEKEAEKELSQCTFKPRLYSNKYNNRIQSQDKNHKSKSIYEKNSLWSNKIKNKKENERKKKMDQEKQGCTFAPKITSLPKYKNKKSNISNREIIGEENYYNKMKKARLIKEEKKKGNNLVEKYDERKKKEETLPRSVVTFGNFNIEKSEISGESINNNNNVNNAKIERYAFKDSSLNNIYINNNINNNEISERTINNYNIINMPNNIGQLSNINIDTNKFINDKMIRNKKSESNKNKINPNIIYDLYTESSSKKQNQKMIEIRKNINSNNIYQRENIYDFDNNYIEDKFLNKNKSNVINNYNFLNPTIHYEGKEQEKENPNNSTGTMTKANSIISLQKKSTHSLPDRPSHVENLLCFNINDYKYENNFDNNIINKNKNINDNLLDEEYIRQKKLLMNELHNWSNYDEESNDDF